LHRGRLINRTYDARNRLAQLQFPDGRGDQAWAYTPDGLTASITTWNQSGGGAPVVNAYAYNKRRLLTAESVTQPGWYGWGLDYDYDANGHHRGLSYPTGLSLDMAPNALGQATQVRDQHGTFYVSGAQYHPNGALKQFMYGNGVVHTMHQNARQLPERVINSGGVLDYHHYYDRNGNPEHIANNLVDGWDPRDRWMHYDGVDRLTAAGSGRFGGDHWHQFTYDALDNLSSWTLNGVKDYAEYVYDTQHRLTNIRNTAGATVIGLGYDAQGNLANHNGQAYAFDFGNRLREVVGKEHYRYDGLGRRVFSGRPTNRTLSMYSQAGQVMYEEDGVADLAKEHIYFAGSLIASRERHYASTTPVPKYVHTDALGSPVAATNAQGQVIERNDYEPYGAIIGKPNHNGIGYTGHVMDGGTGLTYMQQRYYDQSIGRFLSVDPVTANSVTGANFNRYKYAENNPYSYVDPDGRASDRLLERMAETFGRETKANESLVPYAAAATAILAAPAAWEFGAWWLANPATANSMAAGAAEIAAGDALGGAALAGSAAVAGEVVLETIEVTVPKMYGPYYRYGDNVDNVRNISRTGELRGNPARNFYQTDVPAVKAYQKPKEGLKGFQFYTPVAPTPGSFPPRWHVGTPGVKEVNGQAVIPCVVTCIFD
jgi:RHS repeat-associated protein